MTQQRAHAAPRCRNRLVAMPQDVLQTLNPSVALAMPGTPPALSHSQLP